MMRLPIMRLRANQRGFLHLPNDNIVKTIGVALVLCLICSVVVSAAATILKPKQVANKLLDKKANILSVSGIELAGRSVDEAFEQIETRVINLQTGEYTDAVDAVTYDQRKASKDPGMVLELSGDDNIAQIAGLPKYANVYLVRKDQQLDKIILPIEGYGLWGTLYGFLALHGDAKTVSSITFYEHKETPGLGGEVENPKWQASWDGKQLFNDSGQAVLGLIKGTVGPTTPNPEYKIDGLAGATLTSNGVTNMVQFWVSEKAFGPFLQRIQRGESGASAQRKTIPELTKPQLTIKLTEERV